MKTELLIAEFLSTPWALMPERLNAVSAVMARWSSHAPATAEVLAGIDTDKLAREARRQTATSVSGGGIAVLPLYGVITQRGNMIEDVSGPGSVSTQKFAAALRQALADESVSQILIDIDSPGGSVYGVAELADEIVAARAQKPIIAIANSLAASAAYWIGCSASEFYVTPGGEVGSIGVWQAHFDYSQALAAEGVTPTLISAGTYKVEGNPYAPLEPEAQAFMQSRVDDYYLAFCKGVARGRDVPIARVRNSMGQGRVLGADAAIEQGMIDGAITLEGMLNKLQRNSRFRMPAQSRLTNACRSLSVAVL